MYCTNCGQQAPEAARFCPQCGNSVGRDKKIAGVCAGLAKYADIDVTIVRILWVAGTLGSTIVPGLAAYILAWLIVPVEPEASVAAPAVSVAA